MVLSLRLDPSKISQFSPQWEPYASHKHLGSIRSLLPQNSNTQSLTRQPRPLNPRANLLHGHFPREIRTAMLGLNINTERTKPTIVRRTQLIHPDPSTRLHQPRRDLLRALDRRVQRVRHPDEGNLLDALGVATDRPTDLLVDARLVRLGRQLDEEVARVHGEERREQRGVRDVVGVDRVAVAAGAGVDADVGAFGGGEAGEDAVVEVDEGAEEGGAGPGVAGVVFGRQTAFCGGGAVSRGSLVCLSFPCTIINRG